MLSKGIDPIRYGETIKDSTRSHAAAPAAAYPISYFFKNK